MLPSVLLISLKTGGKLQLSVTQRNHDSSVCRCQETAGRLTAWTRPTCRGDVFFRRFPEGKYTIFREYLPMISYHHNTYSIKNQPAKRWGTLN